jgi:SAM-dependent methyltransferase
MNCIICDEENHNYLYMLHGITLWQCDECGLVSSHPSLLEDNDPWVDKQNDDSLYASTKGKTQTEASMRYLETLKARDPNVSRIILVASPNHIFSTIAQKNGMQIVQHLTVVDFEQQSIEDSVDAVVFLYQLEKSNSLRSVLNKAYNLLKPKGTLLVIAPSLDSSSARFFGSAWTEWRPENKYYFDDLTIQSALWKYGFNEIQLENDLRWYTLSHINDRASSFPKTWLTRSITIA